jgi:hypothetical protein
MHFESIFFIECTNEMYLHLVHLFVTLNENTLCFISKLILKVTLKT